MPSSERFVPERGTATLMAAEHIARYRLAAQLVRDSVVLDAGCGSGYGSAMLAAGGAKFVVGIDLAGQIRRIRPDVPVVLMSGHGGVRLANRAAEIGVNEVLHKPLQRGDLAESFARHLRSIP